MQAGVSPFRRFMLYWLCVFIIMFLCMQYFLNVPIKIIIIIIIIITYTFYFTSQNTTKKFPLIVNFWLNSL